MASVHKELAGVTAQIEAMNAAILSAASTPTGGKNTKFLGEYADAAHNARKEMLNLIKTQGDFSVQSMKVAQQADVLTEKIQQQRFGLRDLINDHKNLAKVYEKQRRLQKSVVSTWGTNSDGSMNADIFTPNSIDRASKGWTELKNKAGFYNQVLSSVADNTVKWGKNTQWAGRQLSAGLSMPILAAAAGMGALAYQIDKGLTQVTKVYGDASTQYAGMSSQIREETMRTAKQMADTYGQSAKDSIEITSQLAAAGQTGVQLQQATAAVTRARTLGELDLQDAMKATITLQSVYRMDSAKLGETFDFMNSMENQTNLTMQDFVVGIPKVSGILKEFNGTVQDAGVLLAAMKAGGIDAAEGANAIKSISFKIIAPNNGSKDLFQELTGKSFDDTMAGTEGVVERLQLLGQAMKGLGQEERVGLIQKMFGLYQGSKALTLLDQLTNGSEQMTRAFQVAGQDATAWAQTAQGEIDKLTGSAWNRLKARWEGMKVQLAEFGQTFLEMAVPVLAGLEKVVKVFNNLGDGQKKFLAFALAGVAALGPLIMFAGLMGNLIGNVFKFSTALAGVGLKFRLFNEDQIVASRLANTVTGGTVSEAAAFKALAFEISQATRSLATFNSANVTSRFGANTGGAMVSTVAAGRGAKSPTALPVLGAQAITSESAKTARNWGTIRAHGAAFGIGTAAAVTSMATESGSMANNIANAAVAASIIAPLITKIPIVAKGMAGLGKVGTKAVAPLSRIAPALMGAVAAMGPVGWAAAAAVAAVGAAWYVVNKNIKQSRKEADAYNNSASAYAKAIGFTYTEAGTRIDETGKKIGNLSNRVAEFKKTNADMTKELSRLGEGQSEDAQLNLAIKEGQKAALHGANKEQAQEAVKLALGAMNSALANMDEKELTLKINSRFDFGNMDAIANQQVAAFGTAMVKASQQGFDQSKSETFARFFTGQGDIQQKGASAIQGAARDMWTVFSNASKTEQSKVFDDIAKAAMESQNNLFSVLNQNHADAFAKAGITNATKLAQFARINPAMLGQTQGGLGLSEDEINNLKRNIDATKNSIEGFGGAAGIAKEKLDGMVDFSQMRPFIGGLLDSENAMKSLSAASAQYERWLVDSKNAGFKLTEAEKLRRLNLLRTAQGLPTVTKSEIGFKDAIEDTTGAVKGNIDALMTAGALRDAMSASNGTNDAGVVLDMSVEGNPQKMVDAYKDAYSTAMEDVYSSAASIMQEQEQATLDGIKSNFDRQNAALEAAHDKAKEQRDGQREAINKYYDSRTEKVKEAIKAEQAAEDMRQKIFEAEKKRIERLADMYNRNIDITTAINSGRLDDAAKLSNDAAATQAGWLVEDAQAGSQSGSDKKVEALNKSIENDDKAKDSRLKALDEMDKAEQKSYDAKKKLLDQQQKNAEAGAKRQTAIEKRELDARLAVLKAAVPRNQAEMNAHIAAVEKAYSDYGITLKTKGSGWGQVVGSALTNAVALSRTKITNDANWEAMGRVVAERLASGAFNMSLSDFMKWVTTGEVPKNYKPGATPKAVGKDKYGRYVIKEAGSGAGSSTQGGHTAHSGGIIGKSASSRVGYSGKNLSQSEVQLTALKGEGVLNRNATRNLGSDFIDMANKGLLPKNIGGPDLMGGAGMAGVMAMMMAGMVKQAMSNSILSAGMVKSGIDSGAAGFDYSAMAGKPGKYGGSVFTQEQLNNAATIAATGKGMGASNRDIMIALMTAMQESTLRNLNYGDRDSLGLFQQRDAWGSAKDRTNPAAATRMFFNGGAAGQRGLFDFPGRGKMTMGQAAQAVQVSAFPGAYDKWADEASAILSSLNFTAKPGQNLQVGSGGWVRPASGPRTSPFGMRVNPVTGQYKLHAGSDIGAPSGASIRAAKTGTVVSAGMTSGYGNYTILDHGGGMRTAYAHQSRIGVRAGQTVQAGQVIGNVGSTGNSTGPHLHFEYMKNGVRVNPNQIIPGLKTGGFAMSDGLANLHKGEAVLPARLTEQFKRNVAESNTFGYDVRMDFNGAVFSSQIDFEKGVENALLSIEKRKGANRKVG